MDQETYKALKELEKRIEKLEKPAKNNKEENKK